MAITYTPIAGSLASLVIEFQVGYKSVHSHLRPALDAGLLKRSRDHESTEWVYSAGPLLPTVPAAAPMHVDIDLTANESRNAPGQRPPVIYGVFSDGSLRLEHREMSMVLESYEARGLMQYLQRQYTPSAEQMKQEVHHGA